MAENIMKFIRRLHDKKHGLFFPYGSCSGQCWNC